MANRNIEFVQSNKHAKVYYDPSRKVFIKTFKPKPLNFLRYMLGLRRWPGHNFLHIARRLQYLGIQVPEILVAKRCHVEMKEVEGPALQEVVMDRPDLQEKYVDLIITLYRNNIYCRGLHTRNFLVHDDDLVAIDLDPYRILSRFGNHQESHRLFFRHLKRFLSGSEAILYQRIVERLRFSGDPNVDLAT